jgi:TonB-dependent SusC/RagA subfamily outer membrane receptor
MTRHSTNSGRTLFGCVLLLLAGGCARGASSAPVPHPCDTTATTDAGCVAVGYGMQARRTQAGTISSYVVDAKDLSGVGRVEQLLEGRVPGVTMTRLATGELSIRIRGGTSASNGGEPLIVIDGMAAPLNVPSSIILGGIAPASVARIDVLKGSSAAVYGARGSNGVILITTRR